MALKKIVSMVRRCVEDYGMIRPGDRVAVGVSGGKDSLVLLTALAELRGFFPVPFTVEAITLDLGHADGRAGMDGAGTIAVVQLQAMRARAHQIGGGKTLALR